ncbi:MAG TPA: hypothetical protein VJ692_11255 [Nitrospiraceae bacterium]|nr:hypothetical protein [Nitrospiraceae bacterium]
MLSTMPKSLMIIVLLLLTSVLTWGNGDRVAAAPRPSPTPVVFEAHDYGFPGPDRIAAGVTTMQIINKGRDLHHIQLVRLLDGKTAADFGTALKADASRLPSWVKLMGGPNAVIPGGQSMATMNLMEGDYLLICLIPDKKGVLHVALGMQKALTVKGGKPTTVSEPKAGATITLNDFRFTMSRPIQAGMQTIGVMNQGTQPHEVVVVQLAGGASVSEFIKAIESDAAGSPPGKPIGGVVGLERGDHAFFTASSSRAVTG